MHLSLLFVLLLSCYASRPSFEDDLSGQDLVDHLNKNQTHFKAKRSKYSKEHMKIKAMKKEFVRNVDNRTIKGDYDNGKLTRALPTSFDARTKWSNCPTIGTIYDQSTCGSCWAFSSAEVMSDRFCIYTGTTRVLSPGDILSCCTTCGDCSGGYPIRAFNYWISTGVCTGGPYHSTGDCKPYQLPPCSDECSGESQTPSCVNACQQGYSTPYQQDRQHGYSTYQLTNVTSTIQNEIFNYGPVVTCFDLYEDFYHYSSGIYKHTAGSYIGGHCVKVIGWGTENNIPYWLAVNSWNTTFGENGLFRVAIGTNGVDFDNEMMAGIPNVWAE